MKNKILITLAIAVFAVSCGCAYADNTNDASAELKSLVEKIQIKLKADQKSESDLAPDLKEFDNLLAEHKGEKTDDVARILLMKAMLYKQVLHDDDKGDALMQQLYSDFPDTKIAKQMKMQEERDAASKKIQAGLAEGKQFPDFDEKDLNGKPLSIANYKGKIVMLDFWATWCPPCRAELPNVIKTYQKHHDQGFEIIGISLDKDRDKLTSFLKQQDMPWQQYFDGGYWQNKLAVKYGIESIPATFLLDGNGKIIGKDLRGEDLEEAVTKALAKK